MTYVIIVNVTKEALQKAIDVAGSQAALARALGKTQGHVAKWVQRNSVPANCVLAIEAATGISRHDLRPDIFGEAA